MDGVSSTFGVTTRATANYIADQFQIPQHESQIIETRIKVIAQPHNEDRVYSVRVGIFLGIRIQVYSHIFTLPMT
jgi:hypothetical protein